MISALWLGSRNLCDIFYIDRYYIAANIPLCDFISSCIRVHILCTLNTLQEWDYDHDPSWLRLKVISFFQNSLFNVCSFSFHELFHFIVWNIRQAYIGLLRKPRTPFINMDHFNPSMESNHMPSKVWGEPTCPFRPKLQQSNCWSLEVDAWFHSTFCTRYTDLSMLWLKCIHFSKLSPHCLTTHGRKVEHHKVSVQFIKLLSIQSMARVFRECINKSQSDDTGNWSFLDRSELQ